MKQTRRTKRNSRHGRVRAKVNGSSEKPRISVFRSNRWLTVQVVDDVAGSTLLLVSDMNLPAPKKSGKNASSKIDRSRQLGKDLAALMKAKGLTRAVFDRGGYMYHGRVRALAEGLREGDINI